MHRSRSEKKETLKFRSTSYKANTKKSHGDEERRYSYGTFLLLYFCVSSADMERYETVMIELPAEEC